MENIAPAKGESAALVSAFKQYSALNKAGKYKQALPFAEQALKLSEQELGADHKTTGILLYNLGEMHRLLGNLRTAIPMFERSLAIYERLNGKNHPSLARFLVRIGFASRFSSDYVRAEKNYQRYLTLVKTFDPAQPSKTSAAFNNLAGLYRELGRHAQSEAMYLESIKILRQNMPKMRSSLAVVQDNFAVLLREQGRFAEAEKLHKLALADLTAIHGADHLDTGHVFNNLGSLYLEQGLYTQAEPMMERAVQVFEKNYPETHQRRGFAYDNLAGIKRHLGKMKEAEKYYNKALGNMVKSLHPNHPDLALALNNLSMLYVDKREFEKALPLQTRSMKISRHTFGDRHENIAFQLANLGDLYLDLKKPEQAEVQYTRSVAMTRSILGGGHPSLGKRLALLAFAQLDYGKKQASLKNFQEAAQIFIKRSGKTGDALANAPELKRNRHLFAGLAISAWQTSNLSTERRFELSNTAFQAAQRAMQTAASAALSQMAARFGAGDDKLAALVREHQDLETQWQKTDASLLRSISLPPKKRNKTQEEILRERLEGIEKHLAELDKQLANDFPQYADLSNPQPLKVEEIQNLLKEDEAAVQFLFSKRGGLAWLFTNNKARWVRIGLSSEQLRQRVSELRRGLTASEETQPSKSAGLPFDLEKSNELYNLLFGKLESELAGIKHLIVIPSGALTSLPPAVLITRKPERARVDYEGYRQQAWLIRKFAITVLPSATSLRALRIFARRGGRDRSPFVGIGDPGLAGPSAPPDGQARSASGKVKLAKLFRGRIADVQMVRQLTPLPETTDELKAIATSLNAQDDVLYLRDRASETILKKSKLDKYRIVAFATHGLVAGDLSGLTEPALVLTPPDEGSIEDDGLLMASEVAQMKLDADWVLLSACNTAASDGRPGAEGLSGLARAFFYSGARSILVSHWPVLSYAAVNLTTGAFKAMKKAQTAKQPIGRAEAMRQSILAFMNDPSIPMNAHPETWAPFVLVGEGAD